MLIRGASGSGKSGLALDLMSRGAALVADDRVALWRGSDLVIAGRPPSLPNLIEARGLGLLTVELTGPAPLAAVLDLSLLEDQRLPPQRKTALLGVDLPLLHNSASPYFAAGLMQYLKGGRRE